MGDHENAALIPTSQIRVCWTNEVSESHGDTNTSTHWARTSDLGHEHYEAMTWAGIELFGFGSHWIEERTTAPMPKFKAALLRAPISA
jgi:hypothetical protein